MPFFVLDQSRPSTQCDGIFLFYVQPSRDTVTNFYDNFEKAKGILIAVDTKKLVQFHLTVPNQFSETIIMCVWLRIARMQMAGTQKHRTDFLFCGKIACS